MFYHYSCHGNMKSIRKDGQINPSPGFYDRTGVWLTEKGPDDYSKEDILWNNYEYDDVEAMSKLSRAACYVRISLPLEKVEDLSYKRKPGNDLWIWPHDNGPLALEGFKHTFGVMEGAVDLYLRNKVMAAAERAYDDSSITRALRRIEYDRSLTPECQDKKIKYVRKMFKKIVKSKYHIIEFDASNNEDSFMLTQKIGLFLCDYVVSSNTSVLDDYELLFDKFLDMCVLTYIFLGLMQ